METVAAMGRHILETTAEAVSELYYRDMLPKLPEDVNALNHALDGRPPTLSDLREFRWLIQTIEIPRHRPHITGVASFRKTYDYYHWRDSLEVAHVAGSARACTDLMRYILELAKGKNYGVFGAIDIENPRMKEFLERLGFVRSRQIMESPL